MIIEKRKLAAPLAPRVFKILLPNEANEEEIPISFF